MAIPRILSAAAALCLLAAGCAAPRGLVGEYRERRPVSDTFQVLYAVGDRDYDSRAQDLALLRAAELCLETGYPRFIVVEKRRPRRRFSLPEPGPGLTVKGFAAKPAGFFTFDAAYIVRALREKYGIGGAAAVRELRAAFAGMRGEQRLRLSFDDSPPNEYVFMGYYPDEGRIALRPASGRRIDGGLRSLRNIRSVEPLDGGVAAARPPAP